MPDVTAGSRSGPRSSFGEPLAGGAPRRPAAGVPRALLRVAGGDHPGARPGAGGPAAARRHRRRLAQPWVLDVVLFTVALASAITPATLALGPAGGVGARTLHVPRPPRSGRSRSCRSCCPPWSSARLPRAPRPSRPARRPGRAVLGPERRRSAWTALAASWALSSTTWPSWCAWWAACGHISTRGPRRRHAPSARRRGARSAR